MDVVEVSGANQYRVKPTELVTTCVPPIVRLVNALPDELAAVPGEAPAAAALLGAAELEEPDELAHAATASTAAARPAVVNSFRIEKILLTPCLSPTRGHDAES